jgi:hypothetical protein
LLSRPEAGEPTGARGQFGGFLSRSTEMAGSACGAPVGGSARESNLLLQKERSAQRNCRHKRGRHAGTNTPCVRTASNVFTPDRCCWESKPTEVPGDIASNRRDRATTPR